MSDEVSGFRCLVADIVFWEGMAALPSDTTMSLTVGCTTLQELAVVLAGVLDSYPSVIRWHSARHSDWANRVQERRIRKVFTEDPPGFEHTQMLEVDGVLTNASTLVPPLAITHLKSLLHYMATLLIVALDRKLSPIEVCKLLSRSARKVDETTVAFVRDARPDLLSCRVVSRDSEASVMQFFGSRNQLEPLWRKFENLEHLRILDDFGAWSGSIHKP